MTSAPASVSWSWITSTSSGPMPAISNAARDASTVAPGVSSIGSHGLCTSNAPSRLVRTVVARRYTGVSVYRVASSAGHNTTAAAPSSGLQNMYCVSG